MNILRDKFCKEMNVPMGLDNVYDYVLWLEKKLNETNQALQLLQPDVSTSFPNQCKCIGNAGTNCFTGNCTVCGKRK